jgi:hypothetical protein
MGNTLPPVPFNPHAPERLRDYLRELKQGIEVKGVAVADATGAGDVVAQFNALLASLRTVGIIKE